MKILDKILNKRKELSPLRSGYGIKDELEEGGSSFPSGWFYSFEFFPPATEAGLENLQTRIERMTQRLDPFFINITWGHGGRTANTTMAIASYAQKFLGVDVLLHLTSAGMSKEQLIQALQQAKAAGINNILALRGDPPRGKKSWQPGDESGGFCPRAIDLVKLIRELYGNDFGIAVAGHPEGHPSSNSPEEEMQHLKEKIDAGADVVITQFFYDTELFLDFCARALAAGITCPIIPGIMPIQSYSSFKRMTEYCQIKVPPAVWTKLDPVKSDDEAVKDIGCDIAADMCRQIITASLENPEKYGVLDMIHFYTLNLERSVSNILLTTGAVQITTNGVTPPESFSADGKHAISNAIRASTRRVLPWRPSAIEDRSRKEQMRPINWANRPKSYVMRTEDWDEFPNGRWGDSTSPAFGELSNMSHFYAFSLGTDDDRRAMLGENLRTEQDVYDVFAGYIEGKIPHIPWCETPLQPESFVIQPQLSRINRAGFLTINSQPAVNGESSTHQTFGWGGHGGYVYQKAYCECFCSPENMQKLVEMTKKDTSLNLYAVNSHGVEVAEGFYAAGVTALTWGVFPNREIVQPTVFDPAAFLVWAEEAFALWTQMWLSLYDFESPSYDLIEDIRDTYYLCAIINNDYVGEVVNDKTIWNAIESSAGLAENKIT